MSKITISSKKLNFSFLALAVLLFVVASISFGTIGSAASTEDNTASFDAHDVDRTNEQRRNRVSDIKNSPVFAEFESWTKEHNDRSFGNPARHKESGEEIAVRRSELLKELIRLDPKAALEMAMSPETYKNLPSFVAKHSEKQVSAYGDFFVYIFDETDPATGTTTGSHIEREVVIGESIYKAFVYGRREAMTTKLNIPLQGIVLDDVITLGEQPLREIEPAEYKSRRVNSDRVGKDGIAAEVGGKLRYFSDRAEFGDFVGEQIEWESKIGPDRTKENFAPEAVTSPWTEGTKTVLVMRIDFPDRPGDPLDHYRQPLTKTRAESLFANEVNPFFANSSYNKTSLQATVTTLLRLPKPMSDYTSASEILADARITARAAGFETNNFNLDIVYFTYTPSITWVGIATVGGKGNLLNGAFYLQETAHELGHNYGLLHANLWRTVDGTVIGAGNSIEYGDCYDVMGVCVNISPNAYFNTTYKRKLDWLTDENVQTVTSNGAYRIFAQDSPSPGGIRTLKIRKDDTKNYWVEFRQLMGGNSMNGALIRWDGANTQLLDMTPSTSTLSDAPLLIGQSFYDSESQVRITVLGKGGTSPESLDVKVEFGASSTTPTPTPSVTPIPQNCTYSITPSSQSFGSAAATGSVSVTTQPGCNWTAVSSQGFVTVTSGSSGNGSGTVTYAVAANTGGARAAAIIIAGQVAAVQQSGAATGSYTLTATPSTVAPGGQLTVEFTAPTGSSPTDWVGLFSVGALNTNNINGGYTNGLTAGGFNVTAPTQPGQYEFRYLLNNGSTSVATSNIITVQAPAASNFSVSGAVRYGITPSGSTVKNVSGVVLNAVGSSAVSSMSDGFGNYQLTGLLNGGNYTVTPTKTGEINDSVSSFDASMAARQAVGLISLTANQMVAADASGDGTVSSYDAALIARKAVGLTTLTGSAGEWKFVPPSKYYPGLTANQTGQNFEAILMGDVSGNWTPTGSAMAATATAAAAEAEQAGYPGEPGADKGSIGESEELFEESGGVEEKDAAQSTNQSNAANESANQSANQAEAAQAGIIVTLPTGATAVKGETVVIPVLVGDTTGQRVLGFDFTVSFNRLVLQPAASGGIFDTVGTLAEAASFAITTNTETAGQVRISGFGTNPLNASGTLIKLRFIVVGTANTTTDRTNLTFSSLRFNEGAVPTKAIGGTFIVSGTTAASVSAAGRVTTQTGRGIRNVVVTMTDTNGNMRATRSTSFGYYRFDDVAAGETYVFTASGKRFSFEQNTIVKSITEDTNGINFIGSDNLVSPVN